MHCITTAVSYVVAIGLIYPGYIAPLAAYHVDQYSAAASAARGLPFSAVLLYPRPVNDIISLAIGHAGYEAMIAFYILTALVELALAMTLCELYLIRRVIAWWIAFPTLVLAMSATDFYFNAGYDPGSLAAIFGMLGILAWESRRHSSSALITTGALFLLSALAKESFLPVLVLYAIAVAVRDAHRLGARAGVPILLAFGAAVVSFADARLVSSPFVGSEAAGAPYHVSFALDALFHTSAYYLGPDATPALLLLAACCAAAIWLRGRLRIAAFVVISALSLLAPYLILPNHELQYYIWVPWPLLMLLIPIALTPAAPKATTETPSTAWQLRASQLAVAVSIVIALIAEHSHSAAEAWSLNQQDVNRSMMTGIRSLRPQLATAREVLVTGLASPFLPWAHPAMLDSETGFRGHWTVTDDPQTGGTDDSVRRLPDGAVHWSDYDLIAIFAPDGSLSGAYTPQQLRAFELQFNNRITHEELLGLLRTPDALDRRLLELHRTAREVRYPFIAHFADGAIIAPPDVKSPTGSDASVKSWPIADTLMASLTVPAPLSYSSARVHVAPNTVLTFAIARPYAVAPTRAIVDITDDKRTERVFEEDVPPASCPGRVLRWQFETLPLTRFANRDVTFTFRAIAPTADHSDAWVAFGEPEIVDAKS